MTTGKPQQMAEPSNSSDDLIAELSKLMAQEAHGNRQDAAKPLDAVPHQDFSAHPAAAPATPQAAPFTVRIPGAPAPQSPPDDTAPPAPRFDFGRAPEPVATPHAAIPTPSHASPTPTADEPAPFSFDFDQQSHHHPEPQPQPEKAAPQPVDAPASVDEHDSIADLIAAELLGTVPTMAPQMPAPAAPAAPMAEAAPVEPVAPTPVAPAPVAPKIASWAPAPIAVNPSDRPNQVRPTLRPVNLTPIHRTEPSEDSFRVPPVFGLGTHPAPAAPILPSAPAPEPVALVKPRAEHGYLQPVHSEPAPELPADDIETGLDPIDEIESLIGRAVRVDLDEAHDEQPPERPLASPALRSLATPTAPPPGRAPASGVDEAILAAAAATGAQVDWVEAGEGHQTMTADEPHQHRAPRRAGLLRAFAGPVVAVALLLAAGFGLYSVLGLGGSDGPAPVLVADTAPIKQVPEAKSPAEQAQQSIVFNEIDGVVPGVEEQLVSRDQADVNEVTALPPAAAVTDEGLANRKVRTVTVRPDGTIVSGGDESIAGAAILPVDRPNVPTVPGAATPSDSLLASAGAIAPTPAPEAPAPAAPVTPLVPGTEIAAIDAAGAPIAGRTAPVPYLRPASVGDAPPTGPVNAIVDTPVPGLQPVSAELPAADARQPIAEATAATPPPTNAPAYAQLSSQRSADVAQQIANDLAARYASLLNGARLEVTRADLGERGVYYRVRVPAASRTAAAQFCVAVVANGGECVAM